MRINYYPEQLRLLSIGEDNMNSSNENAESEFPSWVFSHPFLIIDFILLLTSLLANLACLHLILKRLFRSSSTRTLRSYLHVSMLTCAIMFSAIAMGGISSCIYNLFNWTTLYGRLQPSSTATHHLADNHPFRAILVALYLLPAGAMPSNLVFLFVDQVLAVLYPHRTMKRSSRKALKMATCYIAASWVLSALSTSLFLIFLPPETVSTQPQPFCSFHDTIRANAIWLYVSLLLHFYSPILLLFVLTAIFHTTVVSKTSKETRPLHVPLPPNARRRRCFRRTTTRNLIWTCVFVSIAWLPLAVLRSVQIPKMFAEAKRESQSSQANPSPFSDMFEQLLRASEMLWCLSIMFTPCLLVCREHRRNRRGGGGTSSNSHSNPSYSYSSTSSTSTTIMTSFQPKPIVNQAWRKSNNYSCRNVTSLSPARSTGERENGQSRLPNVSPINLIRTLRKLTESS